MISTRLSSSELRRLIPLSSEIIVMMFSKTAITVESAANDMNMKKSVPHALP